MYHYVKSLQYPINIKCKDLRLAKNIISQYGGPDGELAASLRYLLNDSTILSLNITNTQLSLYKN